MRGILRTTRANEISGSSYMLSADYGCRFTGFTGIYTDFLSQKSRPLLQRVCRKPIIQLPTLAPPRHFSEWQWESPFGVIDHLRDEFGPLICRKRSRQGNKPPRGIRKGVTVNEPSFDDRE